MPVRIAIKIITKPTIAPLFFFKRCHASCEKEND
jgi:hypothetical protein